MVAAFNVPNENIFFESKAVLKAVSGLTEAKMLMFFTLFSKSSILLPKLEYNSPSLNASDFN